MTFPQLKEYLDTLNESLQKMYYAARDYITCNDDTLEDEWQIAVDITTVFDKRAIEWHKRRSDE